MGKIWRNTPKVVVQARRDTDRPQDHDIDWIGIWIILAALAVVVAVFWPVMGGEW